MALVSNSQNSLTSKHTYIHIYINKHLSQVITSFGRFIMMFQLKWKASREKSILVYEISINCVNVGLARRQTERERDRERAW